MDRFRSEWALKRLTSSGGFLRRWCFADSNCAPLGMVYLEGACLADKLTEFAEAEIARIEIRRKVGKLISNCTKRGPAVFGFHLIENAPDDGRGRARWLKRLGLAAGGLDIGRCIRQQVFGVSEASAGLPEALRGLLLTESEDIHALLANARREPCEITVGRDQTETVETTAVQEVHRVDDKRDVGGILADRVGKLLLRDDGMACQDIDPGIRLNRTGFAGGFKP